MQEGTAAARVRGVMFALQERRSEEERERRSCEEDRAPAVIPPGASPLRYSGDGSSLFQRARVSVGRRISMLRGSFSFSRRSSLSPQTPSLAAVDDLRTAFDSPLTESLTLLLQLQDQLKEKNARVEAQAIDHVIELLCVRAAASLRGHRAQGPRPLTAMPVADLHP